jgi:hypothetical protein
MYEVPSVRPSSGTLEFRDAAKLVIQRAEKHLSELEAQRAFLLERIKKLQQVTSRLLMLRASLAAQSVIRDEIRALKKETSYKQGDEHWVPSQDAFGVQNLRRACRIALMEAGRPASAADILKRIRKRGSYSFSVAIDAMQAIVRELNFMAAHGEVCCHDGQGNRLWQRNPSGENSKEN